MCTLQASLLPDPENSLPTQTGAHLPPDPGCLHWEKASRVHPTTFVSQSTIEACGGSPQFLWNKRGRRTSLCTGGWFSVYLGDTFCVCSPSWWVVSQRRAVECSALTSARRSTDGEAVAGRRCWWWGSAAALVVRPPSFRCCPSPPLLGADHTRPVRSASVCSTVSLACAALGFIPGEVHGGTTRVTSHTHRRISSGSSETLLFQDLFIFSNYRRAKTPFVYVG